MYSKPRGKTFDPKNKMFILNDLDRRKPKMMFVLDDLDRRKSKTIFILDDLDRR